MLKKLNISYFIKEVIMEKKNKNISQNLNNITAPYQDKQNSGGNELLQFFIGIILLGAGLFMLSKLQFLTMC